MRVKDICLVLIATVGLPVLGGCVKMIDVLVDNRLSTTIDIGDRFTDTEGRLVTQDIGRVPARTQRLIKRAVPRGKRCHLEVRDMSGRLIQVLDGPGQTAGNRFDGDVWMITVGS